MCRCIAGGFCRAANFAGAIDGSIWSGSLLAIMRVKEKEKKNKRPDRQHVDTCSKSFGCTHSLGFFLGPGLPFSLGGAFGSITGGALFRPATAPPPLLRLPSILGGGASELGSGVSAPVAGTGVEVDSSDLSPGEGAGGAIEGVCSGMLVVVVGVDDEGLRDAASDTIRERASGATLRVTMRVFREALGVDFAGVAIVGVGRYWCGCWCNSVYYRCWCLLQVDGARLPGAVSGRSGRQATARKAVGGSRLQGMVICWRLGWVNSDGWIWGGVVVV